MLSLIHISPGWLVNWGITAAFIFIIVCLGIAAFVKYPDKLVRPAKLFTENPPVEIVSKLNAEIDSGVFHFFATY